MPLAHRLLVAALLVGGVDAAPAQVPTLVKDFARGCAECGGGTQFSTLHELALAADGSFLVADGDAPMLRRFDPAGKLLWSAGRKGGGPGEYQYILRASIAPDGSITIADLGGRRLTMLGPDHAVTGTAPFQFFATTAGTDGRGGLAVGAESPRGGLRVFRVAKPSGESQPVALPDITTADGSAAFKSSSVALSPSGVIAVVASNERYQILRIDGGGTRLADLTRAIERVRRTPAEEFALRLRIARGMGAVRAAAEQASGTATSAGPPMQPSDLSLKPHFAVDGLRYDQSGRLWARTMRGDGTSTVFDLFAPGGAFLGSVTIEGEVQHFAFGGRWMLTSGEDSDGVPQVTRWTLREP